MGMAHRGRLNVLAHMLRKPYEMILSEFEGVFLPTGVQGDGDVKYHLGYSRDHRTQGRPQHPPFARSNPSHLEAIDPVVEGIVRAKQGYLGDRERRRVVPVLMHGDAAFTGQGHRSTRRWRFPSFPRSPPAARFTSSSTTRSASPRLPRGVSLHSLSIGSRDGDRGAGLPRQRRRSGGGSAGGAARDRVSPAAFGSTW